jgi:hypothetical protein
VFIGIWQWTPYVALGGPAVAAPERLRGGADRRCVALAHVWRITLPLLMTIVTAAILRSVDLRASSTSSTSRPRAVRQRVEHAQHHGFRKGFEFFEIGYASALMITLSAIVLGAVVVRPGRAARGVCDSPRPTSLDPGSRAGRAARRWPRRAAEGHERRHGFAAQPAADRDHRLMIPRRSRGWCCPRSSPRPGAAYPPKLWFAPTLIPRQFFNTTPFATCWNSAVITAPPR